MIQQLIFNFALNAAATFGNFFTGSNIACIELARGVSSGQRQSLYVWGDVGVGRTHLLQACCRAASEKEITAIYIPLQQYERMSVQWLEELEHFSLLCIDDMDAVAGNRIWEEALFHLYNRMQAMGSQWIVSAGVPPAQLMLSLPDLQSRLTSSTVFQLQGLSDQQKLMVLQMRAEAQGLHLSEEIAQFLLTRCDRDMPNLMHVLEKLAQATLVEQRRLTIPFVKQVLDI